MRRIIPILLAGLITSGLFALREGLVFQSQDRLISSGGIYENGALDGDSSTSRGGSAGDATPVHAVRDTPKPAPKPRPRM